VSNRTFLIVVVVAVVLVVLGVALSLTPLAVIGLFGGVAVAAAWAFAAGGDWLRDASADRFTRDRR
jgi:hypothetical protein